MVGLGTLNPTILVRIQAPEQSSVPDRGASKFMKKRVFIVHGWGGHPEEGWFRINKF